jgi:quercetin dioxygenase-like cupin family protein
MKALLVALVALVAAGGCGDGGRPGSDGEDQGAGSGALGAGARVETLARAHMPVRPPGELAWVADEYRLEPGETIEHAHQLAFVYGRRGAHTLITPGATRSLPEGGGAAVAPARRHHHRARERGAVLWEIRLARPGSSSTTRARRVFESDPLEGVPEPAALSFLAVTVPPRGGRTTVHTHPGPELIYQLSGRIDYQNALIGTRRLGPGGLEGIPPDTPVQKRNPFPEPAVFLSWFAVDPHAPFAPKASF